MKRKTILLTGGSGFIGRNILEKLSNYYNFYSPTHHQLNLLNQQAVHKYIHKYGPFDFVIHAAIVGGTRKDSDTPDIAIKNLEMFLNLYNNSDSFLKFINLGSGIEYGREKPIVKVNEVYFGKNIPQEYYGLAKFVCAKLIENDPKFLNLRLFGVYGKYEDYSIRFISNTICKAIFDLPIRINRNIIFDYLYIDDLVQIISFFIDHDAKFRTYNITTGEPIDLVTIAKKIIKISGKKLRITVLKKGLKNEYSGSNKRLEEEAKYEFKGLDSCLFELYRWYLDNKKSIRRELLFKDYF